MSGMCLPGVGWLACEHLGKFSFVGMWAPWKILGSLACGRLACIPVAWHVDALGNFRFVGMWEPGMCLPWVCGLASGYFGKFWVGGMWAPGLCLPAIGWLACGRLGKYRGCCLWQENETLQADQELRSTVVTTSDVEENLQGVPPFVFSV